MIGAPIGTSIGYKTFVFTPIFPHEKRISVSRVTTGIVIRVPNTGKGEAIPGSLGNDVWGGTWGGTWGLTWSTSEPDTPASDASPAPNVQKRVNAPDHLEDW